MGRIRDDVRDGHHSHLPQELAVVKPFTNGFNMNWAGDFRAFNTDVSVYLLEPETFMQGAYGFQQALSSCTRSTRLSSLARFRRQKRFLAESRAKVTLIS
jgi:hypothetical protein